MGTISGLLKEGMHFLGAHIDAPRLDIKSQLLYEEEGVALFKTHYYGGIKKYQWVTMPLSLHGVVYKKMVQKLLLQSVIEILIQYLLLQIYFLT
ncbi:hypothetical protein [endosymbiont 'TC1' of Trimyema compressum]|uniref:hypothetical protein n=1 Tax=endosymbiont 'TC1' of Trimyema compressum TaxID=243899 RepID=UPI001FE093F6|nr:hypothetical protein [endosymbiont 'TC1' of Trimyema compressum]